MTPLERECRTYVHYLCGQEASPYLLEKYLDFHQKQDTPLELDLFDAFLVRFSSRGGISAGLADTYARLFRKESAVRQKLILTCALLESAPPSFEALDSVPAGGFPGAVLRIAGLSARFIVMSVLAAVILGPARLWLGSRGR